MFGLSTVMRSIRNFEAILAMCMIDPRLANATIGPKSRRGYLALIVLLDQFSRNLYRGDAWTFEMGVMALEIADTEIEKGWDRKFTEAEQIFF
jgi:uncharacterized protein (DUF924 family)